MYYFNEFTIYSFKFVVLSKTKHVFEFYFVSFCGTLIYGPGRADF